MSSTITRRRDYPSDQERYTLSFPTGMKEQIKRAARAQNRSMNAEIVHRLQLSLEQCAPRCHVAGEQPFDMEGK
ncbi:Arc family DNA-binding protein [Magnetofaba australis]|uniref:Arc family DNA-binding protein n=1 Tax=Magnetofaba australis TaxID=1472297 RepID=UPI000A19F7C9|nr:Arc family DNA-binding protein [Magnetofaba australis]